MTYTLRNVVWDNLCDFIMGKAKAKICFDASVSQQIFNAGIAHNKK